MDEILAQFSKVSEQAANIKEEIRASEADKQKQQFSLIRQMTSVKTEKEMVAQVVRQDDGALEQENETEDDKERKHRLRERQKNIKVLRKQILALAQEKLAKQF